MIDWFNLLANSLCIFALAPALATISYASWQASISKERFTRTITQNHYQTVLFLSAVLFCGGQAIATQSFILRILWALLGVAFVVIAIHPIREWIQEKDQLS